MLEITVWDVQHGSATYIKTPNNRHIVVDLGDNGTEFSPLGTLYARGVRQLDGVIVTHPHRDHMDDIYNLALHTVLTFTTPRHLTEQAIRAGNRTIDASVVTRYLEIRNAYSFSVPPANTLTAPVNFGGVNFQIFSPHLCEDGNLNNHSLVIVVSYAGLKMVIPGDNEAPSWNELLGDFSFRLAISGADVLLATHHGRDAGWCAELFEAMGKPRLVLISDGRFGDTSATGRYSNQTRGWTVYDAGGTSETRNCVTTRCDGHITVKFGWNGNNPAQGNFLNVTTSKVNNSALLRALIGTLGR